MYFGQAEIDQLTESIWGSVLGWEVEDVGGQDRAAGAEAFLTGRIRITGTWEGTVQLACAPALARQAAAVMFGLDEYEVPADLVRDAVGELTNITGGNLKALLPEPCRLCLPDVTDDDGACHPCDGGLLIRASFRCRGYPFVVAVLELTTAG